MTMKKKYIIFAAAVAMLSTFATSCQKEETGDLLLSTVQAVIDPECKTHLSGNGYLDVDWDLNDQVMISVAQSNNHDNIGKRTIFKVSSINGGVATLQPININGLDDQNYINGTKFCALYPATSAKVNTTNGSMQLNIPLQQRYAQNSINGSPMYAEYSGNANYTGLQNYSDQNPTFRFKNLCSQLRLNLQANGVTLKSITLTSTDGHFLSGNFNIVPDEAILAGTEGNQNPTMVTVWKATTTSTAAAGLSKRILLDCGDNGVNITEAKDFNIYLPVGEYNISITLFTTDGREYSISSNQAIDFNRNHVKKLAKNNITFPNNPGENETHPGGIFAINYTDHVYIAPSNLQNTAGPNAYYDESWTLTDHPYDMIGSYATNQTVWNRFSWSTIDANDDFGMMVIGHTNQTLNDDMFLDWGANELHYGSTTYPAGYGFTLSVKEWAYMLGFSADDWGNLSTDRSSNGRLAHHMNPGMTKCYGYVYILPEDGYQVYAFDRYWGRGDFLNNQNNTLITEIRQNHQSNGDVVWSVPTIDDNVGNRLGLGLYDCGRTLSSSSNDKYAGIPCLVIYPDDFPSAWQLKDEMFYYQQHAYAINDAYYQKLKSLGCAFIPLVGQGQGAAEQTTAAQAFHAGYYWTSTANGNNSALAMMFTFNNTGINIQTTGNTRGNGNAVRLVSHAPADSRHSSSKK